MADAKKQVSGRIRRGETRFAAVDLGSNNCRLLIATPVRRGFRIVGSFSRIVRLGEGVASNGRLSDAAMDRTIAALKICAEKIEAADVEKNVCIATQACRAAGNGSEFVERIQSETGLKFEIISPETEASLSVRGCSDLIDTECKAVLVFDIGGGSTELSWLRVVRREGKSADYETVAWTSVPVGVVTFAERWGPGPLSTDAVMEMEAEVAHAVAQVDVPDDVRAAFEAGDAHLIGTSGTVTSLAGIHLDLERYSRAAVDGLWMSDADFFGVYQRLQAMSHDQRGEHSCIGPQRADLVVPGSAILKGILQTWGAPRLRVGDRGLREGLLLDQIAEWRRESRRRT